MADNDIVYVNPTNNTIILKLRSVDRGGGLREVLHGVLNSGGNQIDPATETSLLSLNTAVGLVAKDTTLAGVTTALGAVAKDATVAKDASVTALTTAVGLVAKDSTVAKDTTVAAVTAALTGKATTADIGAAGSSPPALATGASGLIGWQRKTVDILSAGLNVVQLNMRARDTGTSAVSGTVVQITEARHGLANVRASFSRPANTTPYDVGDLVAQVATQNNAFDGTGNVVPLFAAGEAQAPVMLNDLRMSKTSPSLTNAVFRVHVFTAVAGPANGDNGVFNTAPGADKTVLGGTFNCSGAGSKVGSFTITMGESYVNGAFGRAIPDGNTSIQCFPASGKALYFLVEALGSYTPASAETFTFDFGIVRDSGL